MKVGSVTGNYKFAFAIALVFAAGIASLLFVLLNNAAPSEEGLVAAQDGTTAVDTQPTVAPLDEDTANPDTENTDSTSAPEATPSQEEPTTDLPDTPIPQEPTPSPLGDVDTADIVPDEAPPLITDAVDTLPDTDPISPVTDAADTVPDEAPPLITDAVDTVPDAGESSSGPTRRPSSPGQPPGGGISPIESSSPSSVTDAVDTIPDGAPPSSVTDAVDTIPDGAPPSSVTDAVDTIPDGAPPSSVTDAVDTIPDEAPPSSVTDAVDTIPDGAPPSSVTDAVDTIPDGAPPSSVTDAVDTIPDGAPPSSVTGAVDTIPDEAPPSSVTDAVDTIPDGAPPSIEMDVPPVTAQAHAITFCENSDTVLGIPVFECSVLVELYEATDGANWDTRTGWEQIDNELPPGTPTLVTNWHGVTVQGGRVTELSLFSNNLSGEIPPSIGNLTNLGELALASNSLSGAIPSAIGDLTNLTRLSLSGNDLSGEIPPSIGNLTNLDELVLASNNLTGDIPSAIGSLTNLTRLSLFRNDLSGEIPPSIGNLTNLTDLVLASNNLTGAIPSAIGNLVDLTRLNLSDNVSISGEVPLEIGYLLNLENLDLSGTNLTGTLPYHIWEKDSRAFGLTLNVDPALSSAPASTFILTATVEIARANNLQVGWTFSGIGAVPTALVSVVGPIGSSSVSEAVYTAFATSVEEDEPGSWMIRTADIPLLEDPEGEYTFAIFQSLYPDPPDTDNYRLHSASRAIEAPLPITLDISSTGTEFMESAGRFVYAVLTASGIPEGEVITVTVTSLGLGSATIGEDYELVTDEFVFSSTMTQAVQEIEIVDDNLIEGTENTFILYNLPDGVFTSTSLRSFSILDNDSSSIRFADRPLSILEGASEWSFDVIYSVPLSTAVAVRVMTSDDTAIAGEDYTSVDRTLTLSPDVSRVTVTVPIEEGDDSLLEGTESFQLELSAEISGITISDTVTVAITDNDTGTVSFSVVSDSKNLGLGVDHSCGIIEDGSLVCWGFGTDPGPPDPNVLGTPVGGIRRPEYDQARPPLGTDFISVSAGWSHSCALRGDGTVVCWGLGSVLGGESEGSGDFNQAVPPDELFTSVTVGYDHTCGIKVDGKVACWGTSIGLVPSNREDLRNINFISITAGRNHTCGVTEDGETECWGFPLFNITNPPAGVSFLIVTAGESYTCGIKEDSEVLCWGRFNRGQFHDDPPLDSEDIKFRSLTAGGQHTCGIKEDGETQCWGRRTEGQFVSVGVGGDFDPVGQFLPGENFVSISGGEFHTCGIKEDGEVQCSGNDFRGSSTPPAGLRLRGDDFQTATVFEGSDVPLTVNLNGGNTLVEDIGVVWSVACEGDVTPGDFQGSECAPVTLTIAAGTVFSRFTISTNDDNVVEGLEEFTASITGVSPNLGGLITIPGTTNIVALTVQDNDRATVSVSAESSSVFEGTEATFRVSLSDNLRQAMSLRQAMR